MKRLLAYTMLLGALSLGTTFAQRQGGPDHNGGTPPDPATMIQRRVDSLATLLGLTDAQKTQALKIFTDAQTAAQSVQTSLGETRTSLETAVKSNDAAAIDRLAVTYGAQTGQMIAIQSKADAAFYALLTADQKTRYDELHNHGAGGPGGMMGRRGVRF